MLRPSDILPTLRRGLRDIVSTARSRRRDPRRRYRATDVSVQRVHHNGVWARVSTVGRDGERTFVLVPGIGVAATYFERLAPALNEFGPVHALDLPGFGGVPHPVGTQKMGIGEYAELVGAVIDELGLDDPVVLGHSMGTQVVAELAARRPDLTTIVLLGPVMNRRERSVPVAALRFAQSSLREPPKVAVLAAAAYVLCGPRWFSRVLPAMMHYPIEQTVPLIRASTLVIRGEFDRLVPREWTEEIADAIPHARAWEVPGASHSVMHAHAEEVARLCVEHARAPRPDPDEAAVRRYPDAEVDRPDEDDASSPDPIGALRGRLTELTGILVDDDSLIAEGKTQHAEASDPVALREQPSLLHDDSS
ncbi:MULTISPECIES: alpha/beta fold hydrolase [unclassified Rathayibacter]|uniref:alpha/beta fold hydrolase n=1 Tax=unclassified Rathayibacter TaxID=2609250 RepID=UPI00188B9720|nr:MULTISPECIES: alpha/beta fold hydrolase [unclassified Rathayibacter]MBF4463194.1 alpha/beta fold hydrolase [Rathayibacter sp. VKM Ac-2879]MBF4504569.1 alpha/beta fold hydrolase [Rathayibacter sp. VKM Ac-2878]